ncbi:serine/threonine-protein kinase Psk2p [Trichomonascus vanleenenianus]|uniref:serine/threonine protein kinase PSK2 n=1 Tax=Trichomonascus vanleenenianus TaxID=2268995 RepID=UPI003ECA9C08
MADRSRGRPDFYLETSSDEEEEDQVDLRTPVRRRTSQRASEEAHEDAIHRFSSQSLHSYSYAIVAHNSIGQRIAVLKNSLKFLQENPQMFDEMHTSLSTASLSRRPSINSPQPAAPLIGGGARAPPPITNPVPERYGSRRGSAVATSPVMERCSVATSPVLDRRSLASSRRSSATSAIGNDPAQAGALWQHVLSNIRSSASSATLSMLNSLQPLRISDEPLSAADQSSNIERILEILESAYASMESQLYSSPSSKLNSPSLQRVSSRTASFFVSPSVELLPSGATSPTHKRTLTNTAAHAIASQILEALATPYIDASFPSFLQRSNRRSVSSFSNMVHSVSSLNLTAPMTLDSDKLPCAMTPMVSMANKLAAKHSVFTTRPGPGFEILSANDIACLIFGFSQSQLHNLCITDIISPADRAHFLSRLASANANGAVIQCGAVYPIVKSNGHENMASFWAKQNTNGFVVWVVEEVLRDKAIVHAEDEGSDAVVKSISGVNYEALVPPRMRPPTPQAVKVRDLFCHDPLLEPEYHYATVRNESMSIPCLVRQNGCVVEIASLPYMAGVIVVRKRDLTIVDYNDHFMHNLFGYEGSLAGKSIDTLMPRFTSYVAAIAKTIALNESGLVLPEHMFRKMAALTGDSPENEEKEKEEEEEVEEEADRTPQPKLNGASPTSPEETARYARFLTSHGIEARNAFGDELTVDVQLRVVSAHYYSLWITYTRTTPDRAPSEVPSQLQLYSEKRRKTESAHSSNESVASLTEESVSQVSSPTSLMTATTTTAIDPVEYAKHTPEIGARRRIKKIEDFEILDKMGEGAYGKVLLAQYRKPPKVMVVVKCVIKERILVDTWTRDKKLGTIPNEIKVMAALNSYPHESIIKLLDFFEDDDYYHIEMERHGNPGTDLFDLIELKADMSEQECRSLFKQVVSAVAHLHRHGIVHRDIKDENIVVDERGKVKLIDFGSSAFVKQGPFDVFVGTLDYAAPEVLGGKPYAGKPQDVWALGILLYTIVYKENPFYNVDEIVDGNLRVPFVLSKESLDLVLMMLTRDVNKRPHLEAIERHPWLTSDD